MQALSYTTCALSASDCLALALAVARAALLSRRLTLGPRQLRADWLLVLEPLLAPFLFPAWHTPRPALAATSLLLPLALALTSPPLLRANTVK